MPNLSAPPASGPQPDLIISARRVVTRNGIHAAAVHIRSGQIIAVLDLPDVRPAERTAMPGDPRSAGPDGKAARPSPPARANISPHLIRLPDDEVLDRNRKIKIRSK